MAGTVSGITRGLLDAGADARQVSLDPHVHHFDSATVPTRLERAVQRLRDRSRIPRPLRPVALVVERVLRLALFVGLVARYDTFVVGYCKSYFSGRDLPWLRRLGKRIVVVYFGTESRPPYLNGKYADRTGADLRRAARRIKRQTVWFERHADVVVANPLSSHYLERPFVAFQRVGLASGWSVDPRTAPHREAAERSTVRLLHAPTHPRLKGSARIEQVVDELHERGVPVELVELRDRPNHEVVEALAGTDLVVDQLYSDTYLAGLATEAARLGVPSVVGSYGIDDLRRWFGAVVDEVAVICHPDDLAATIEALAADPQRRAAVGDAARRYVEDEWAPRRVGERLLELIDGRVDPSMLCDPADIHYLAGCGLDESEQVDLVRRVLRGADASVLQLDDKPTLRDRLVERARLVDEPRSPRGDRPKLVSVIVPAYNAAATIEQQLTALERQDYEGEWEVVVGDNGSTDGTAQIVERWRSRLPSLRVVDASARAGSSFARNEAVRASSGDFLCFCDADDVVADDWISNMVRAAGSGDVLAGILELESLNDPDRRAWRGAQTFDHDRPPLFAPSGNMGIWRDVFDDLGGFDEHYLKSHDTELGVRARAAGVDLVWARDAVVHVRYRETLKGLAKQAYRSGKARVQLDRDHGSASGMHRSTGAALRSWAWWLVRTPYLLSNRRRGVWVRRAAVDAGRLVGCVRYGVWSP